MCRRSLVFSAPVAVAIPLLLLASGVARAQGSGIPRTTPETISAPQKVAPDKLRERKPKGEKDLRDKVSSKKIGKLPLIERFESLSGDCPAKLVVFPRDFLSYAVSRGITRVVISAVYDDGRLRVVHDQTFRTPEERSELTISDPGMSFGQVAYVIDVTGPGGRTSRRLEFRTPAPVAFEIVSRFTERIDEHRSDFTRSHYEANVRVSNPEGISSINLQGKRRDGTPVVATTGEIRGSKLVSRTIAWDRAEADRLSVDNLLVRARTNDCRGRVDITREARLSRSATVLGSAVGGRRSSECKAGGSCTVHPDGCSGRGSDWEVTGTWECRHGKRTCVAQPQVDYCTGCGGACGGCDGNSCSKAAPCAPGSVCGTQTLPWSLVCRPLDRCSRIDGFCWRPDELEDEGAATMICSEAAEGK